MREVWRQEARLSAQIRAWAAASVLAGGALGLAGALGGDPWLRAFGGQNAAWGLVDAGIAAVADRRRVAKLAAGADPRRERRWLRRLLLLNAGLDVGYLLVGLAWLGRPGRPGRSAAGHGAAIVLQGGFLLVFDLAHARAVRPQWTACSGSRFGRRGSG